jgi:hypothetical protein
MRNDIFYKLVFISSKDNLIKLSIFITKEDLEKFIEKNEIFEYFIIKYQIYDFNTFLDRLNQINYQYVGEEKDKLFLPLEIQEHNLKNDKLIELLKEEQQLLDDLKKSKFL